MNAFDIFTTLMVLALLAAASLSIYHITTSKKQIENKRIAMLKEHFVALNTFKPEPNVNDTKAWMEWAESK